MQRYRASTPRSRLSGAARLADVAAHALRPTVSLDTSAVIMEVQHGQAVSLTLRAAVEGRHSAAVALKELPPLAVLRPRMVTRRPRTDAARHFPFRGSIAIGVREIESICSAQLVGRARRGGWRDHGRGLRRGDPRVRPTPEHQQRDEHSPHRRSHYHTRRARGSDRARLRETTCPRGGGHLRATAARASPGDVWVAADSTACDALALKRFEGGIQAPIAGTMQHPTTHQGRIMTRWDTVFARYLRLACACSFAP